MPGAIDERPAIGAFTVSDGGWTFGGALTLDDAAAVLEASKAMPLPSSGAVDFRGPG